MSRYFFLPTVFLVTLAVLPLATARGQGPPFGGPDRGGWRGRGSDQGRDHSRGSSDHGSSDRASRLESFLQSMDANRNGILEVSEVPPERRGMLQFFASRMGLDASQPIPISRIREAVANRSQQSSSPSTPQPEKKPDQPDANKDKKAESAPLVPGFGVEQPIQPVPAFGERVPGDLLSLVSAATASAAGATDSRIREYAQERFRRYDRNQSGNLEKEEWSGMRGDPASMDRNRDGRLTLEEYTAGVADYARARLGGSPGSGGPPGFSGPPRGEGGSPASEGSATSEENSRKSYRFLEPHERLPSGLPSWFTERDGNRDGQVSMAEYSSSWSDDKAGEFAQADLNGDGLLTPEECLKAPASTAAANASPSSTSSASQPAAPSKPEGGGSGGSTPWWMQ